MLAWACRSWQLPLFWVLFSASTYLIAFLSSRILHHCESSLTEVSAVNSIWRKAQNENLRSSHCRSANVHRSIHRQSQRCTSSIGILLQIGANCFAFVHSILGTLTLAGLNIYRISRHPRHFGQICRISTCLQAHCDT